MSGFDLVTTIQVRQPDLPCLMLTGHDEPAYARRTLDAGARGYVTKGNRVALLEAMQTVLDGEAYLSEKLRREMLD